MDPEQLELESGWVWYAHFPCASVSYGHSYAVLGSFHTVAGFWRQFNNTASIDAIHNEHLRVHNQPVIAYSLFRTGVRPEWEDPINMKGSEWGCRETLDCDQFRMMWEEFLLGAIGEQIVHCVGIRAINKSNKYRRLHKIEVWMDRADAPSVQECHRSFRKMTPTMPLFTLIPHEQKHNQAADYQRRRRRGANAGFQ